jgi:hypothetical protein
MTLRPRQLALIGFPTLLTLVFLVGGWLRTPEPEELKGRTNLPKSGQLEVGDELSCVFRIQTSWRRRPTGDLRMELPESLSVAPDAEVRLQTIGWGVARWYVLVRLTATRSGAIPAGSIGVPIGREGEMLSIQTPSFTATMPPVTDSALETAPMPQAPTTPPWVGWIVTVLLGLGLWYLWYRHNRPTKEKPVARTDAPALADRLAKLEPRLEKPDAALFGELCDLVAEHLQLNHDVPATGLTLREQAAWLSQSQALKARMAEPLLHLWRNAEVVRFAGSEATTEQARNAFEATEALVGRHGRKRP